MKYLVIGLKGMAYGITHVMPGLGGALVLILLGVYEQFVDAVGNFFIQRDKWREHLAFLVPLGIGMVLGMVLLAKLLTTVLENYSGETMIFFMGLLVGTIPTILRIHRDMKPTVGRVIALACGIAVVVAMRQLNPDGEQGAATQAAGTINVAYNTLIAFLAGGASVSPGLDGSTVLLLGGTYDAVIAAVGALPRIGLQSALILLSTAIGAVLGILICSKLIDTAIRRVPSITYYVVLGLIAGALYSLWPRTPLQAGIPVLALLFAAGLAIALFASREPTPREEPVAAKPAE